MTFKVSCYCWLPSRIRSAKKVIKNNKEEISLSYKYQRAIFSPSRLQNLIYDGPVSSTDIHTLHKNLQREKKHDHGKAPVFIQQRPVRDIPQQPSLGVTPHSTLAQLPSLLLLSPFPLYCSPSPSPCQKVHNLHIPTRITPHLIHSNSSSVLSLLFFFPSLLRTSASSLADNNSKQESIITQPTSSHNGTRDGTSRHYESDGF